MAKEPLHWPEWDKPATKGDLIASLVRMNAVTIRTYAAISALNFRGKEAASDKLANLSDAIEELQAFIDKVGGRDGG